MSDYYNNDEIMSSVDDVLKKLSIIEDKLDKLQLQLDDMEANQ